MDNNFPQLLPGGEPFFHRGDSTGVLCLHGFMASPAEVRWLGSHLAGCGFTVFGARLAGHGTIPQDMTRVRWRDWYASALDGYHLLRASCQRVFVVGHSMGGMLGLLLASSVPVDGLAVLASPVTFNSRRMAYARWLKYAMRFTDQTDRSDLLDIIREEQARRGEAVIGRVRYDRWATGAVGELYTLACVVYDRLPLVSAPLLLVYSEDDRTVPVVNRELIASRVRSTTIQSHLISGSDHILTQDRQRETVFSLVADFLQDCR